MIRKKCEVCGDKENNLKIILDSYPLTETYLNEKSITKNMLYDQKFIYCKECGHGQLENILPQKILYGNMYKFRTSKSIGVDKGSGYVFDYIINNKLDKKYDRVVDIGCNDGYLLYKLKPYFNELVGVDPILDKSKEEDNIKLYSDFIENINIDLRDSLVITSQVLEHLEHPKVFIKNLLKRSNNNTRFIFAFPCLDLLINDYRFDQIFHHHQNYFSKASIGKLLELLGCQINNMTINQHYWGTILVDFNKNKHPINKYEKIGHTPIVKGYKRYLYSCSLAKEYLKNNIGISIYGYGANLQLPILNYYIYNLDNSLEYILDDDKEKDGLYFPTMKTEIKYAPTVDLKGKQVFITANNFSRSILKNILNKDIENVYLLFNKI